MATDPRFEVNLAAEFDVPASTPVDEQSFSIAILGDFGARAHRGAAGSGAGLAGHKAWRVDRDDLDVVLARVAPQLELVIDPNEPPVIVRFETLDDFHPDALAQRLPVFQGLRALREQAATPSNRGRRDAPPSRPADSHRADSAALGLAGGSLLDRIVDNESVQADQGNPLRGTAPGDELAEFVDRAVKSHTVPEIAREQRDLVAKVDDVLAATMRVVLHHPDFQALEALWRGVDFFVRRLDTSESLQVFLVDVSKDALIGDLTAGPVALPWSLLVAAYTFGPNDMSVLSRLATFGQKAGAPFIAAADPRLAGTESFAGDPDSDEWHIPSPPGWEELRAAPDAPFLALALPRFLLRLPYGKRTDACSVVPFEEMPDDSQEHENYLWGNPALLCALAIGESVAAEEPSATQATFERFPLHVTTIDGEPTAKSCAEALLSQRTLVYLLDRGLTPLATARDADAIRLPRLQSVAKPPRPLSIPKWAPG